VWALTRRFATAPESWLPGVLELARLGWSPGPDDGPALELVRRGVGRLVRVEPAALLSGLDALLVSETVDAAMRWLEASGSLGALLPEVAAMVGFHLSSPRAHKDLWEHTLIVVDRVEREPTLRWVALCHDIGKVATRAVVDGTLTFHRHEAVGAWLFSGIAARLGMDAARAESIAFVIEHHARTNAFEPSWSDRALQRLIRECGSHLPAMLAFSRADWTTKQRHRQVAIAAQQGELERRLVGLMAPRVALPDGLSQALMAATGRGPGPWLGDARRWVEAELEAGAEVGDAELWVVRWLGREQG
jgi:poly(A) polymerase